jgi:hypothetical protein
MRLSLSISIALPFSVIFNHLSTLDSGLSRFTPRMLLLIGPKFYNIILCTLLRKRVVSFDPLFQDFLLDVSSLIYSDAGVLVETKLVYQTSLASPESEIARPQVRARRSNWTNWLIETETSLDHA